MSRTKLVGLAPCLTLVLLSLSQAAGQDQPAPPKHVFRLSISSAMDMTVETQSQKLTTETDLKYAWEQTTPTQRTLTLEQTGVRVFLNGKSTLNAIMNQWGTANVINGETKTVRPADAPDEIRTMLADSYGPPLCVLTVDDNQEVVKQDVVAKPGAKAQVDNGMIANCVLFHAPFFADRESFERPIEISMGNGGFAKGTLKYTRAKNYDPEHPKFFVSGKATKDKLQPAANNAKLTLRDAVYDLTGEQVYDPQAKEWESGTLNVKITFNLFTEEKQIGSSAGTMTCKLNDKIDEKK